MQAERRLPAPARDRGFDPRFSLGGHLLKTGSVAMALAALGGMLAWDATWTSWLWVPAFWAVANVVEWLVHRFPMHRPMTPRVLYENHSLVHHHAFDDEAMEIENTGDLCMVMMPWYTLLFIFIGASPMFVVSGVVVGPEFAGVFLVSAVAYFLVYEITHTLHHLPWAILRRWHLANGLVRWLRAHHHHHHRLERMAHVNFNVTFPLADVLLGTRERPARSLDPA